MWRKFVTNVKEELEKMILAKNISNIKKIELDEDYNLIIHTLNDSLSVSVEDFKVLYNIYIVNTQPKKFYIQLMANDILKQYYNWQESLI